MPSSAKRQRAASSIYFQGLILSDVARDLVMFVRESAGEGELMFVFFTGEQENRMLVET